MTEFDDSDAAALAELDGADERVLAAVGRMYDRLDPVPAGLVERVQFGITLEALHAEIAELQRMDDLAGVRGEVDSEVQTVTFTSASVTTMVTVTVLSSDRARIDGWVAPGGGVPVELRTVVGTRRTVADANGRFVFDDVERGLVQFVVRPSDGETTRGSEPAAGSSRPVITPSIEI